MCSRSGDIPTIMGHRYHGEYDTESKWMVEITERKVGDVARGPQGISAVVVGGNYAQLKYKNMMASK